LNRRVARRRAPIVVLLAALALACAAGPAGAALSPPGALVTCPSGLECGVVTVPLDHAAPDRGSLELVVSRLRARRALPSGGALLFLTGGPGQAGIARGSSETMELLRRLSRNRDVIAVDVRGTGRSGALACPAIDRAAAADPTTGDRVVADCAAAIGPDRRLYGTAAVVEDLELVRRRLGIPTWAVGGVSYGTFVALAYARAYPDRVERLLLDSVVPPDGVDPLNRGTRAAAARILRELCSGRACGGAALADDMRRLEARVRDAGIAATTVDRRGVARPARLRGEDAAVLVEAVLAGDLNPVARAALPAAVRSALAGDATLLLRIVRGEGGRSRPTYLSGASFLASLCTDTRVPWGAAASAQERLDGLAREVAEAEAALPEAPFSAEAAAVTGPATTCLAWPDPPAPPAAGPLPDVPVLALAGTQDARTPIEDARALVARMPRTQVVAVPNRGHSIVSREIPCVALAIRRFFADQRVGRPCAALTRIDRPLLRVPPSTFAAFAAAAAGRRPGGLVRAALERTFADIEPSFAFGGTSGGSLLAQGLRGGTVRLKSDGFFEPTVVFAFDRFSYVPGVRISGSVRRDIESLLEDEPSGEGRLVVETPRGRASVDVGKRRLRIRIPGSAPVVVPDRLALAALPIRG
jgi:pimeloyl-ACP methyl ester carboxylesterase